MMNKLILFSWLLLPLNGVTQSSYTLSDLTILAQELSYKEFIQHAHDPRPSERGTDWENLVMKVSDAYSKEILQKPEIEEADFNNIETLWSWPTVKTNDTFKDRRREIGIKFLTGCLKYKKACETQIKSFWNNSSKNDPELAYQLAVVTKDLVPQPISIWSFLEISLKSNQSEFYCKKDFVIKSIWEKLTIDVIRLGPKGDLNKKIELTLHPDCIPYLITEAKKRLETPDNLSDREIAFQILNSQYKASEDIKDFFYTIYLLENPSRGETFNYSWNRVSMLSKSHEKREKLIEKIKKLDPFPDHLFGSLDESKKNVILSLFHKSFPELIDYYVDECLSYYGGRKKYLNGNPTIHCSKFMESSLASKIISKEKILQYQKFKKL